MRSADIGRPTFSKSPRRGPAPALTLASLVAAGAFVGCDQVLGLDSLKDAPGDAGALQGSGDAAFSDASGPADATVASGGDGGDASPSGPDSGGGSCSIQGTTYPSGASEAANACLVCQPALSTSTWSNASDGTTCGTNGICHTGACASGCEIGGVFVPANQTNPVNACQVCIPTTSTSSWSSGPTEGQSCGDAGTLTCCGGSCVEEKSDDQNCGGCGLACSSSCSAGRCISPLYSSDAGAGYLALDDAGMLYFGSATPDGGATIERMPVTGGAAPATIVSGQGTLGGIAVANGDIYWTTAVVGNVLSAQVDGGAPQTIATGQNRPLGIAASSAFAYWADSVTGNIMEARFGGTSSALATAQYLSTSVVLDDSNLYWLTYASNATVDQAALNGTGKAITLISESTEYFGLAIDQSNVYWGSTNGLIRSVKKGGGTPMTIASGLFAPRSLAIDATNVYWANDDGTVMKAPLTGTTSPVTLASGQAALLDIKVDATSVYWSGASGVTKATPK